MQEALYAKKDLITQYRTQVAKQVRRSTAKVARQHEHYYREG